MKKLLLSVLFLALWGVQMQGQVTFTPIQGNVPLHGDLIDSTSIWWLVGDPNDELIGPTTTELTLNSILQVETGFLTSDSLQVGDTLRYKMFNNGNLIWNDSLIIKCAEKPEVMIYNGYQRASHACFPTGKTKYQVESNYTLSNVWCDAGKFNDGNHVIIDSVPVGRHTFRYNINSYTYYTEFYIDSEDKPIALINQIRIASQCGLKGKLEINLSDFSVIDSIAHVLDGDTSIFIIEGTLVHKYVPEGTQKILISAGTCVWEEEYTVKKEEDNIVKIEKVLHSHQGLENGVVEISSADTIKAAAFILESDTTFYDDFSDFSVRYEKLPIGDYEFIVKDRRNCWSGIKQELITTHEPFPNGIFPSEKFNFELNGIPLMDIPNITFKLKIWKIYDNNSDVLVFDSNNNVLPWNKEFNGKIINGSMLYELFIFKKDKSTMIKREYIRFF